VHGRGHFGAFGKNVNSSTWSTLNTHKQAQTTLETSQHTPFLYPSTPLPLYSTVLVHVKHLTCTDKEPSCFLHFHALTPSATSAYPSKQHTTNRNLPYAYLYPCFVVLYTILPPSASPSRLGGPSLSLTGGGCNRPSSVTMYFISFDHFRVFFSKSMFSDVREHVDVACSPLCRLVVCH
jgi:hypothetical protein